MDHIVTSVNGDKRKEPDVPGKASDPEIARVQSAVILMEELAQDLSSGVMTVIDETCEEKRSQLRNSDIIGKNPQE